jgi:lysozyme
MTALSISDPSQACFVSDSYHLNPVDFGKLAAASWNGVKCVGVILKCTQGAGDVDPLYASRVAAAKAAGLLVAAYHFGTADPVGAQIANFTKHAMLDDTMGAWLDYEDYAQSQMTLPNAIAFQEGVDQFTGRTCGMYSADTIKSSITKATADQRSFLAAHAFWLAEYGSKPVMTDVDGKPLPWDVPFLWQFSGDSAGPEPHTLDGLEQGADLSLFNGSPAQLAAAWSLPVIPTA